MRREIVEGRRGFMIAREIYLLMGDRAMADVYQALKALRIAGLVRFVEGSRRRMEITPGAPDAVFDGRGQALTSIANLKYVGKRNSKASVGSQRPIKGRVFVPAA